MTVRQINLANRLFWLAGAFAIGLIVGFGVAFASLETLP